MNGKRGRPRNADQGWVHDIRLEIVAEIYREMFGMGRPAVEYTLPELLRMMATKLEAERGKG